MIRVFTINTEKIYVLVKGDTPIRQDRWFKRSETPYSKGWYERICRTPDVEPWQIVVQKPISEWTVDHDAKTCTVTWDIIDKPNESLAIECNKDVGEYIYGKFDVGTQLSFIALYVDSTVPKYVKDEIQKVWDWIKSVMNYYYTNKARIISDEKLQWDFSQFDKTVPDVSLGNFM